MEQLHLNAEVHHFSRHIVDIEFSCTLDRIRVELGDRIGDARDQCLFR